MKILKVSITVLIVAFIAIVIYLNYQSHFSKAAKEGKANIKNIKEVRKGIGKEDVLLLMGKPDIVIASEKNHPYMQYLYKTNDDSYAHVRVIFDSTNTVSETIYPKNYKPYVWD